jgi:ribosome-associated protein
MEKLKLVVKHLDDKLANNIVVLDVADVTPLADYFIICDVSNTTQLNSLATSLEKLLIEQKFGIHHKEGKKESGWILVDAQDIIVHIFLPNEREKFNLEKLYIKQRKLQLKRLLK